MAQLNALISLPQQVAGLIWKRSEPFLEKLPSGLNKRIKLYRYVKSASDFEYINILSPVNAYKNIDKCIVFLNKILTQPTTLLFYVVLHSRSALNSSTIP